jgi:8-hydroxy-5-deazaflavin:NADPH oxidoreductase
MSIKRIGILGSGLVGQTLGSGFLKHGYDVMLGTRTPGKLSEWMQKNPSSKLGTFEETAAFGQVIVLAAKGSVAKSVLDLAGSINLNTKTIIDATNPIADIPPVNGVLKFFTSLDKSLMEEFQAAYPNVNFVKAFSCIGSHFMVNPNFGDQKPTMFICGNNGEAKTVVTRILDQFGFETSDMGKVEAARAIEPLCMLWCIPGLTSNQWGHAFKLLKAG